MVALLAQEQLNTYLPIDEVIHGDCLDVLRSLPANSLDACVVDPPYGLGEVKDIAGLLTAWVQDEDDSPYIGKAGFMGKAWDAGVPGPRYWREVYRVLKPGAHILCFSGTRTVDLMMIALRLAGFECRDTLMWIHGQGFPKSTAIDKKLDKMAGAERKVIGKDAHAANRKATTFHGAEYKGGWTTTSEGERNITAPATPEAQQWQGWGTNLKPSHEPIILARKPISEKTIAANVLRWGTGGLAIDKCRVGNESTLRTNGKTAIWSTDGNMPNSIGGSPQGRFPSHLLLSHSVWCVSRGVKRVKANGPSPMGTPRQSDDIVNFGLKLNGSISYREDDGLETVEDWECDSSCPVRILNEQSGHLTSHAMGSKYAQAYYEGQEIPRKSMFGETQHHGKPVLESSSGGASRYFTNFSPDAEDFVPFHYFSKSSRRERNAGCEGLPEGANRINASRNCEAEKFSPTANSHPTVKSLSLMSWLCRLVTPPDGIVLDPFAGSGSTLCACVYEKVHFIGIEQDAEYVAICEARIAHAYKVTRNLWKD